MIVVTLIAGLIAWLLYRDREERRIAATIRALQVHADSCDQTYEKVKSLFDTMSRGGEASAFSGCERDMWLAHANLSLARGEKAQAIEELKKALKAADQCVVDSTVNVSGPGLDFSVINAADDKRCQIEVKLADLSPDAVNEVRQVMK